MESANNMKQGLTHCFKRGDDILCREIDGELYLVDTYRRAFMRINPVGVEIWHLLDGANPLCDIIAILKERFDVSQEALERDVLFFVRALQQRELVI
jgi:hypothetical protein